MTLEVLGAHELEIEKLRLCDNNQMSNRRRCCAKTTLVFAILIGLSSAFAQPGPTRSQSIVVFAPHPDDEVIGWPGVIIQALGRRARLKGVDITSGDGCSAGC